MLVFLKGRYSILKKCPWEQLLLNIPSKWSLILVIYSRIESINDLTIKFDTKDESNSPYYAYVILIF